MPKRLKISNQNNDNLLMGIHYSLRKESFGIGGVITSDRWLKVHHKKLTAFYDITEKKMLENNNNEHAIFHSGAKWFFIDDELTNLKIKPKESLIIEFNIIVTKSPSSPLFMQIMTYPEVEAVGVIILLAGLIVLTAALIALIPAVAALITISNASIAIVGGILFAVGITMAFVTRYCQNELDKAPLKAGFDVTMEQVGFPESKKPVSNQIKKMLFPRFFSMGKAENYSVVEVEEAISEETEFVC